MLQGGGGARGTAGGGAGWAEERMALVGRSGTVAAEQSEAGRDGAPIGVIDSGVGGLTILLELLRELPDERYVYFGDTANCPYGVRSVEAR